MCVVEQLVAVVGASAVLSGDNANAFEISQTVFRGVVGSVLDNATTTTLMERIPWRDVGAREDGKENRRCEKHDRGCEVNIVPPGDRFYGFHLL